MKIQKYKKVDSSKVLADKYGKKIISQDFLNPITNKTEEFLLFGQKDWSIIFALTNDGLVLTVEQYKQGCDQIITELPAGGIDSENETPEKVVKKELLEETGYATQEVMSLGSYWIASRSSWTRFHCFLASKCYKKSEVKFDPKEQIKLKTMKIKKWFSLVSKGEVQDGASVVCTYQALNKLSMLNFKI